MRILHVLASAHLGGAEHVCLDLGQALQARGHAVGLLVFEEGAVTDAAGKRGFSLLPSIPNFREVHDREKRWANAQASLRSAVARFHPDIVHSHVPLTNLICHRTLPALSIPWVATVHGSWRQFAYAPETEGRPWLKPYLTFRHAVGTRFSLRSAVGVAAISEYVKRELVAVAVPARKVRVIYNGLSGSVEQTPRQVARAGLGLDSAVLVIGAIGYFAPVKGYDLLIRAVAILGGDSNHFQTVIAGGDVLGDDRYRRRLETLIARHDLRNNVRLIGSQPVPEFMSALDVLVVSSRTEGFSLVLLEAMRRGIPSVVTSAGGCIEVARPEIESVMFRSGSPASLAIALRRLIDDSTLRERLGRASQARAAEFTLERCAEEYEEWYGETV